MSKRRRTFAGRGHAPRPIDKQLTFINLNDVNATAQRTVLFSAPTACTILGIRWSLMFEGDAGSVGEHHDYRWIIVVVKDGDGNENNMSTTDASDFYTPEQNVLAFGVGTDNSSATSATGMQGPITQTGKTKSMRKFLVGDRLLFAVEGIATETIRVRGVIQTFCKS